MSTEEPVAPDIAEAGPGDVVAVQAIDERVFGRAERRATLEPGHDVENAWLHDSTAR